MVKRIDYRMIDGSSVPCSSDMTVFAVESSRYSEDCFSIVVDILFPKEKPRVKRIYPLHGNLIVKGHEFQNDGRMIIFVSGNEEDVDTSVFRCETDKDDIFVHSLSRPRYGSICQTAVRN